MKTHRTFLLIAGLFTLGITNAQTPPATTVVNEMLAWSNAASSAGQTSKGMDIRISITDPTRSSYSATAYLTSVKKTYTLSKTTVAREYSIFETLNSIPMRKVNDLYSGCQNINDCTRNGEFKINMGPSGALYTSLATITFSDMYTGHFTPDVTFVIPTNLTVIPIGTDGSGYILTGTFNSGKSVITMSLKKTSLPSNM